MECSTRLQVRLPLVSKRDSSPVITNSHEVKKNAAARVEQRR